MDHTGVRYVSYRFGQVLFASPPPTNMRLSTNKHVTAHSTTLAKKIETTARRYSTCCEHATLGGCLNFSGQSGLFPYI